ncbi:histone-lysine N-methyltransferase SETMAR [Elysia marginata]|uniref:Histone-lysine N-methyltransferase SETMAR n=1 Tax=Elysia marginata TaxID=1093978 RepID=A0AAV4FIT5_9GAST|nr:histone-lysine N-methyltransferase SETMAR [Elysia marginata]
MSVNTAPAAGARRSVFRPWAGRTPGLTFCLAFSIASKPSPWDSGVGKRVCSVMTALWIHRVRPNMDIGNLLLLHDNVRTHTSIRTRETIASFGWTTLPHPSYSPDLAPSDYHLFGPMKQALRGKHYENDEEVKSAVKTWLKEQRIRYYKLEYGPL